MATKRRKKPTKQVKTLAAKSLTPAQSKGVKGGIDWSGPGDKKKAPLRTG